MSTRSYDHYCGLGFALDVIGERWAALVVRELLCGPRRFSDLLAGMPGVATNTLTTRLEELERSALIVKTQLPPPAAATVYGLTEKGRGLEPAIVSLVRWATPDLIKARAEHRKLAPLRASWLAIALKAFFSPARAKAAAGAVALQLPTGTLLVKVEAGAPTVRDLGPGDEPEATLSCPEDLVIAVVTGGLNLKQALRQPGVTLSGDGKALARVLTAFEPAAATP